ncbi:MAG: hypothetical protein QOJ65_436 [Fimbriimonadaceae bacterium]|jgi:hypothetical protein|nr:hypothetical protein [Fimbriimonadaceae bacterium]
MKFKGLITSLLAVMLMASFMATPVVASAQTATQLKHRQKTKNDWRNLAYAGAGLGIYGALKHDNTLTFLGTAGAIYSATRYEQDRKSHSRMRRNRAAVFSRGYFYRNGKKYVRKTSYKNGRKYYYFKRA